MERGCIKGKLQKYICDVSPLRMMQLKNIYECKNIFTFKKENKNINNSTGKCGP